MWLVFVFWVGKLYLRSWGPRGCGVLYVFVVCEVLVRLDVICFLCVWSFGVSRFWCVLPFLICFLLYSYTFCKGSDDVCVSGMCCVVAR